MFETMIDSGTVHAHPTVMHMWGVWTVVVCNIHFTYSVTLNKFTKVE